MAHSGPPGAPVIQLQNVTFQHPDRRGILDLSLHMRAGTLCGIVGLPGSGKTTLIRLLTGVYRAQRGKVRVLDSDPTRFKASVRARVAQAVEPAAMRPEVLVRAQLGLIASLYGLERELAGKRVHHILVSLGLDAAQDRRIGDLSPAHVRRLGLACALIQSPSLMIADEPCGNLPAPERARLWAAIRSLRERRTLLIATQHWQDAQCCDLVGVLHGGRLLGVDTPSGLCRRVLGGDVLRVCMPLCWRETVMCAVGGAQGVRAVRPCEHDPGALFVHVDSASRRGPRVAALLRRLTEGARCSVEEYRPPFEVVIRRIIGA